jgi:hypothetical protein
MPVYLLIERVYTVYLLTLREPLMNLASLPPSRKPLYKNHVLLKLYILLVVVH